MNFNTRKILIEKHIDLSKKGFCGMKFCSYKSNKESLLVVDFCPEITSNIYIDRFDCITTKYEPINIKIINSIDNNDSFEFKKWINEFEKRGINSKGVDMFFFKLNFEQYQPIMSLRGCSLNSISTFSDNSILSVNFFAHSFLKENS